MASTPNDDVRDEDDGGDLFADAEEAPELSSRPSEPNSSSTSQDAVPTQSQFEAKEASSPTRQASSSTSEASGGHRGQTRSAYAKDAPQVWTVVVVAFDHAAGPVVEWLHPGNLGEGAVTEIHSSLPFLALPDGAHDVRLPLPVDLGVANMDRRSLSPKKTTLSFTFSFRPFRPTLPSS